MGIKHDTVGTQLTQAEWEAADSHHITDLIPEADDTYDLGSATYAWQDLFLEGDITMTDAGTIATSAGALTITSAAAATWSTSAGALTITSAAALNLNPAAGSAIVLDSTINVDAGVVTGATSITSTAFVGTLSTAAQTNITSLGTLTTLTVDNIIINGTNIGHTSDTDSIAIASDGVVTMNQIPVFSAGINVSGGSIAGTLSTASQTNITGVGTISTGTWQGTAIASTYIAADAITGAKIADDAIDSEHYADGSIDNAHIADDAIDSEHYAAGSIDTAHIADNQVTLAKMAGLVRGKIIYGDASGDPAALTVGSANYVLTSDGTDISWAAAQAPSGAQAGITTIYNSSLILGYGASHANIDFTTDNSIIFDIDGTSQIQLDDGILKPTTDVDVDLGTSTLRYKSIYAQKFAMDISADGIAEHDYSGITALVRVGDGADIGAFDLVCISDVTNEVQIADADAIATSRVIGINPSNSAISDNSEGIILLHGVVRDDSWNWTTGQTLYLSTTAGDITATAPSGEDDCVVPIGVALEPDMIYFNPTQTIIEHAG